MAFALHLPLTRCCDFFYLLVCVFLLVFVFSATSREKSGARDGGVAKTERYQQILWMNSFLLEHTAQRITLVWNERKTLAAVQTLQGFLNKNFKKLLLNIPPSLPPEWFRVLCELSLNWALEVELQPKHCSRMQESEKNMQNSGNLLWFAVSQQKLKLGHTFVLRQLCMQWWQFTADLQSEKTLIDTILLAKLFKHAGKLLP